MSFPHSAAIAIVGGGPAGLMAAEVARAGGAAVDVYESRGSVGRKFLVAGKGGLNLTHSEPQAEFASRYGARSGEVNGWLRTFDASALREWARGLGIETFVGSSGRVFPTDLRAAPLLRTWVKRLRESGVRFHVHHTWTGWRDEKLRFNTPVGELLAEPSATILALGGASWPQLGSDGAWTSLLQQRAVEVAPLKPSNCGFELQWSAHFAGRFAGHPVKPVSISFVDGQGKKTRRQGEFVITETGIEGSLVYALSAALRDAIQADGYARIELDLAPGRDPARLLADLSRPRQGRSISEVLRRHCGIEGVRAGLLHELVAKADMADPAKLARWIKALPLVLDQPRPLAEAISTAGGVVLEGLDERLMLRNLPGVFCAGEMLDWEAPTGGYLLAASFASGRVAGAGAVEWLAQRKPLLLPDNMC